MAKGRISGQHGADETGRRGAVAHIARQIEGLSFEHGAIMAFLAAPAQDGKASQGSVAAITCQHSAAARGVSCLTPVDIPIDNCPLAAEG